MSSFDSTKSPLPEIIREIKEGKLQLPDFQRGWVWDDEQVRPIENLSFKGTPPEPERLILDGQQRIKQDIGISIEQIEAGEGEALGDVMRAIRAKYE